METTIDDTPPISVIVKEILNNLGYKYRVKRKLVNISVLDYFNPSVFRVGNTTVLNSIEDNISGTDLLNRLINLFFAVNNKDDFIKGVEHIVVIKNNIDREAILFYFYSLYHFLEYLLYRYGIEDNRRDLVEMWGVENGIVVVKDVASEEGYLEIEEFITE